jgi:hypothetical protein
VGLWVGKGSGQELVRGVKGRRNSKVHLRLLSASCVAWLLRAVRGVVARVLVKCVRRVEQRAKCDVPALLRRRRGVCQEERGTKVRGV